MLRRVIADSPVSRQQLAAATGLSLATVATLVGELIERGVLVEVGFQDSNGGRPRGLVGARADGGALIGVDVAETYIHVELFDLALKVLARRETRLASHEDRPELVVQRIVEGVHAVLGESGMPGGRVLGAGVSVPGQVEREGGRSAFAPNWGWHDVPLRDLLARQLDFPVYLDNPLMACTIAQLWFGAARGRRDVVVVNLGTGVGAGIAIGGSLYRGATNTAGEWGHTTLVLDGRPCHCGASGCVEAYVGAPGIIRTLMDVDPASPLLGGRADQERMIEALARAHAQGDPAARETVRRTARYLGAALANLVNLLNPEAIVLSSWVATGLGDSLLHEVRGEVRRHALARPLRGLEIVLSPIATNPVSLGAAAFALEGSLDSPRAARSDP